MVWGGCEREKVFLCIYVDELIGYLFELPPLLVEPCLHVGMHCFQGLDTCVPICKDSASDSCQNPIINSQLKVKLRVQVKEIENAKAKDCSESK